MKKAVKIILSVLACVILVAGICVGGFFLLYSPSLTADFSQSNGEVSSRASGYLYGIAEPGVPSENMTESLDISSVSQKVAGGLQHPIGDIEHIYSQLDNTDYDVVYLQDAYSTWYYDHENIENMRKDGTYDWKGYLEDNYLPVVRNSVEYLSSTPYSDKLVYCIFNECDNGIWFGETIEDDSEQGFWCAYNEIGSANFFEAWKITYDYVKEINPEALVGGPGFFEYNTDKIGQFLTFCVDNDCVPDVMIYHELNDYSVYFWQQHVREYREMEKELQIAELPIIVTEYGRMCDNGLPGKMLQYITQIECSGVYGDNAYWRLADNLCDTCADDNMPNSNWWLYRWYADMEGSLISSKYQDLWNSNFENAYIKHKAEYSSQGFMGIVSMTESQDRIDVICGGTHGDAVVKLKSLDETSLCGELVEITVEEALYKGISGEVTSPLIRSIEYKTLEKNESIKLNDLDSANAYHIVIKKVDNEGESYDCKALGSAERFEFENGELLGNAYTYDSAYATTGEVNGMVGGMENEGDGVKLTFSVPETATYNLNIIYGNANDGEYNENGKQDPNDRAKAYSIMTLDGEAVTIGFDNTIKSEFTTCYEYNAVELEKGKHTITFEHSEGTYVLDSLLVVSSALDCSEASFLYDSDRSTDTSTAYLVVAGKDGYYKIAQGVNSISEITVNSNVLSYSSESVYYLMRGLNYVELDLEYNTADEIFCVEPSDLQYDFEQLNVSKALLSGGAFSRYSEELDGAYLDGISSDGGVAEFTVNADEQGVFAFTICYSNNDEGGYHDYNVDLIERYVTLEINGEKRNVFCRNTYDWNKYKTVTIYAELNKGENAVSLSNSGDYLFNNTTAYAPRIYDISVNPIER